MSTLVLKAYAKINLSLDILSKRSDGYHEVSMIMQSIGLFDEVSIEKIDRDIIVGCSNERVPGGEKNIAYKAAKLLLDKYRISEGVKIYIKKNIPMAAGLAGGSTDAAAALRGINELYALNASDEELMVIGKQVGADVPFCIKGGTMLAEGIGERLTHLTAFSGVNIILIKPRLDVSTAWVYNNLKINEIIKRPDMKFIIDSIEDKNINAVASNMVNVLETVTIKEHKIIESIKKELLDKGAIGSMMSGSGPTVFGIFDNEKSAKNAFGALNAGNWECIITKTN